MTPYRTALALPLRVVPTTPWWRLAWAWVTGRLAKVRRRQLALPPAPRAIDWSKVRAPRGTAIAPPPAPSPFTLARLFPSPLQTASQPIVISPPIRCSACGQVSQMVAVRALLMEAEHRGAIAKCACGHVIDVRAVLDKIGRALS